MVEEPEEGLENGGFPIHGSWLVNRPVSHRCTAGISGA
jgi:hypothetical protein